MTSREAFNRANPFAARLRQPPAPRAPRVAVIAAPARAPARRCTASDALLRAQLKAGQHVLTFGQAMVVATAIGLAGHLVTPGIGDPTAFKMREVR